MKATVGVRKTIRKGHRTGRIAIEGGKGSVKLRADGVIHLIWTPNAKIDVVDARAAVAMVNSTTALGCVIEPTTAAQRRLSTSSRMPPLEPGNEVTLYYDTCHPSRWSLSLPRQENSVLVTGPKTLSASAGGCQMRGAHSGYALPPQLQDAVASSGAGAHSIACATHNGGQVEPIRWPFAGTVLLESGRTALEEPERANAVPPGGVGEPDADLGEALPKVAFLGRPSFPSGLKYLMRREGAALFHQAPGRDQRLRWRQRLLGDRLHSSASVRQRPPKSVTWPGLPRAP